MSRSAGVFQALVQRRWTDLDAQGHVNNTRIVDYLQEARTRLLLDALPGLVERGFTIDSTQVEYLRPVLFAVEPVRIDLTVGELGDTCFELETVLWDGIERAARARAVVRPAGAGLSTQERAVLARFAVGSDADGFTPMRPLEMTLLGGVGLPYRVWTRWSDVDRYGRVSDVRLFDYVQEARVAVMGQVDPALARVGVGGAQAPLLWLLARQDVTSLAPVLHRPEPYEVRTACVRLGTTSLTLGAELIDSLAGGAVLARAASVLVCADPTGVPTPLPPRMQKVLNATMPAARG